MMKANRFLLTRNSSLISTSTSKPGGLVKTRNFASGNGHPSSDGTSAGVILASFAIFKGKAALTIKPILPKFVKRDSGLPGINKKGSVMLMFMPAIGQRKYDSQKKQAFALNPTELGGLISLDPAESCEFMHDPSMKSSLEGQIKKTLSVTPMPSQNGAYFIGLTVNNSVLKTSERFSLPVTKAEFTVMRTAFSFALPYIMGWNQVVAINQPTNLLKKQLPEASMELNSLKLGDGRLSPVLEWDRVFQESSSQPPPW